MPDKTSSVAGILGPPNSSYLLVKERDIMTSRGPRFSKFWAESVPPPPATKLGRHRQLAPNAGIHVSPLCLGAMSIGEKWGPLGMGEMTKEQSFKLLDAFYAAGGNFIDTANNYQDGESEQFIGEWMEARGVRDQMVVATKYTSNWKRGENIPQKTSYVGNNMKSLYLSVEKSLKDLRTSYIDITSLAVGLDMRSRGGDERPAPPRRGTQGALPRTCLRLVFACLVSRRWRAGCLRYSFVDCLQSEHVRTSHGKDAIRGIPRRLERPAARPRARDHPHGAC